MEIRNHYENTTVPLIQPRGGRSTALEQIKLWNALTEAGADVLPLTIDSKTRLGQIQSASDAYEQALRTGSETLNGFPLLSVPIEHARELINQAALPVSLRHGTPLAEQLVNQALEAGVSEVEGGPLSYSLPYSRNVDLIDAIESWRRVETLCKASEKSIVRENFGILTACLVPPMQAVITNVLECAFTQEFSGGIPMASFGATGNRIQDLASVMAFKVAFEWFLDMRSLKAVSPLIAFHHWMGPFPVEESESLLIIKSGTLIAREMNADKVVTKTVVEAKGIPTIESNSSSVRLVRNILGEADFENKTSAGEFDLVREEVEFLFAELKIQLGYLNRVSKNMEELLLNSVIMGFVDPPFAPHRSCLGKLKSLRAADGSIRICRDFPGRNSENFIARENSILKKDWMSCSSDDIASDIQYPNMAKL